MFIARPTANYAGIEIDGDYEDFDALQDAIYDISDVEYNACLGYGGVTQWFLGLAYDIRHAKQGDREYVRIDNGSDSWNIDWETNKKLIKNLPKTNVYYTVKIPIIQLVFDLFVIDELIKLRKEYLHNKLNDKTIDPNLDYEDCKRDLERVMLQQAKIEKKAQDFAKENGREVKAEKHYVLKQIARNQYSEVIIETFRVTVFRALDEIIGLENRLMLEGVLISKSIDDPEMFKDFLTQFVDDIEMQYLPLTKGKRKKNLLDMLINIIYWKEDEEYKAMQKLLKKEALKRGTPINEIRYNYDFDWEKLKW